MAVIDELLYIKRFREQQAEATLQIARSRLAQAHRTEESAERTLRAFQEQAAREEDGWYRGLFTKLVKVREINELHENIAMLRAAEATHLNTFQQASQHRESAQRSHQQASTGLREASTVREKFVELARQHHAQLAAESERREELEFEELASIVREREGFSVEQDV